MRRISTIAALAGVTVFVAVSIAAGGSGERGGAKKIRVQSELTSMEEVDNAPTGESAGDLLVFTESLSRGGMEIGEMTGSCVLVRPPTLFECTFTAKLPKGRLAVSEQADLSKEAFRGAITGGTGRYRRARGTVLVKPVAEGEEIITFRILD